MDRGQDPYLPNHTGRSIRISQQALPILTQEAAPRSERRRSTSSRARPTRARASPGRFVGRAARRPAGGSHRRTRAPRRRACDGDADHRRHPRRSRRCGLPRRRVRVVPLGREVFSHVQADERDQPVEPRRARRSIEAGVGRAGGACSAARSSAARPTATSTCERRRADAVDPSGFVKGLVGRPRRRLYWTWPAREITRSTPAATSPSAAGHYLRANGESASNTRSVETASRESSSQTSSPSRPPAATSAGRMSWIHTPASRPPECCRSPCRRPRVGVADAYATAAYARGLRAAEWSRELPATGLRGADDRPPTGECSSRRVSAGAYRLGAQEGCWTERIVRSTSAALNGHRKSARSCPLGSITYAASVWLMSWTVVPARVLVVARTSIPYARQTDARAEGCRSPSATAGRDAIAGRRRRGRYDCFPTD